MSCEASGEDKHRKTETSGVERRRQPRRLVNWAACCRGPDGTTWNVTVVDVSEGGFGLSQALPLPVNSRIVVDFGEAGEFPCRIAWSAGGRCGLRLLEEEAVMSEQGSDKLGALLG